MLMGLLGELDFCPVSGSVGELITAADQQITTTDRFMKDCIKFIATIVT